MEKFDLPGKFDPEKEHPYVIMLLNAMKEHKCTLDEAMEMFRKEMGDTSPEHFMPVQEAYDILKERENKK